MRRIILRLSAFVIAFLIGFGCSVAVKNYIMNSFAEAMASNGHHTELIVTTMQLPFERNQTHLPPNSLPVELKRIDEHYQKFCVMPTDFGGEWPTIRQLVAFRSCNEEWANARRNAISAELSKYLVRY